MYFLKEYLACVKINKMKYLRFMGHRVVASEFIIPMVEPPRPCY